MTPAGDAATPPAPEPPRPEAARPGRIEALDVARGVALATMAVYHFSWDMKWFGFVDWPVDSHPAWRGFAMAIAGSFLFLVGIGLTLAHGKGLRPAAALRRIARIALAAAAISLATHVALGDQYVRFGILHAIAAGSLLALPFVRLPVAVTLAAAIAAALLPGLVALDFPGDAWFAWTGLVADPPLSVDYVPLLPWLAAILAGIAAARLAAAGGLPETLAAWPARGRAARIAALAGRHSLAVYLLHQPVLFGTLWLAASAGLAPDPTEKAFIEQCSATCSLSGEPAGCAAACSCTLRSLQADGTWRALLDRPDDPGLSAVLNDRYGQCLSRSGSPGGGT